MSNEVLSTLRFVTATSFTVTVTDLVMPEHPSAVLVAVIVTVPAATPVTTPLEVTVALVLSLLDHERPVSFVVDGVKLARIVVASPTVTSYELSANEIPVGFTEGAGTFTVYVPEIFWCILERAVIIASP